MKIQTAVKHENFINSLDSRERVGYHTYRSKFIECVISLIQSDGDTKDLRSHGNPAETEGASLSEEPHERQIEQ